MTHRLQKGENISLANIDNFLGDLVIATEWQAQANLDIDVSAFLLTEQSKVTSDSDFIFYNQPRSVNDAVLLKDRRFKVSLKQLSHDISRITFVLSIHEAHHRKHSFSLVNNVNIKVFNFATKQEIISYQVDDANSETAIILATMYRYQSAWKFKAVGQGYISGLAVLAQNFGVDIEPENPLTIAPAVNAPPSSKTHLADVINIHDTNALTLKAQYEPITHWFKHKYILVEVNAEAMDTTGFFDEVAVTLGDNYELLKIVGNKIKHRQLNNKDRAYIELTDIEDKHSEEIKQFCKELYDYSFVAKYFFNTQKKLITLHLQSATRIVQFFNGEWLEWYAFMKIVDYCHQRQLHFSCTRNMRIDTMNGHYEIDVFFLINNTPLFIECKSGEYRQFIDKYCKLRKQLNISKPHFLFLIADMNDTKTKGLTAMFDITFINVQQLTDYLAKIV